MKHIIIGFLLGSYLLFLSSGITIASQIHSGESQPDTTLWLARHTTITPVPTPKLLATPSIKVTSSSTSVFPAWLNSQFLLTVATILGPIIGGIVAGFFVYRYTRRDRREQKDEARKEKEKEHTAELEEQEHFLQKQVAYYEKELRRDRMVAYVKILDMTEPVELRYIHVAQRVQSMKRTSRINDKKQESDPNVILRVVRERIEEAYINQGIDPLQMLREKRQCVLLGDPGSGKSTLLKYLSIQALNGNLMGLPKMLPMYVELSTFAQSQEDNLADFIAHRLDDNYGFEGKARAYIENRLREGTVLLLLDALDEAAIGANREERHVSYLRVFNAIEQISQSYGQTYMLVTARSAGYTQRAQLPFSELEILPFRPEEIREFVTKWFAVPNDQGNVDPTRVKLGQELNIRLEQAIRIQTLVANPLLLSLITLIYERQGDLPSRRADLYRRCVRLLLDEWDKKRNIKRVTSVGLDSTQKIALLSQLAFHFHSKNERYFQSDELLEEIVSFITGPEAGLHATQSQQVLDEISADNGLLKAQADEYYGFLHLTFQEYFSAQYVVQRHLLDALMRHRNQPWWEEVILLYAGSLRDIKGLLERLLGKDNTHFIEDDIFSTNILLAGRCIAAFYDVDQEMPSFEQEVIQHLWSLLDNGECTLIRERAATTLVELGRIDVGLESLILRRIEDATIRDDIRVNLVNGWRNFGTRTTAVSPLLALFLNRNTSLELRMALRGLFSGTIDSTVQKTLLAKLKDNNTDPLLYADICAILISIDNKDFFPELLPVLQDPHNPIAQRLSIATLWIQADDDVSTKQLLLQLLQPVLDDDTLMLLLLALSGQKDAKVAQAFLHILSTRAIQDNARDIIVRSLVTTMHNSTITFELLKLLDVKQIPLSTKQKIVQEIGVTQLQEALQDLQRLYVLSTTGLELRQEIQIALYMLGDSSVSVDIDKLLGNVKQAEPVVWYILTHTDSTTLLSRLTDAKISVEVRVEIAATLASEKGNAEEVRFIVSELCRIVADTALRIEVRKAILHTLAKLADDKSTIETLISLMGDRRMRDEAQEALWFVSRRARLRIVEDPLSKQLLIGI